MTDLSQVLQPYMIALPEVAEDLLLGSPFDDVSCYDPLEPTDQRGVARLAGQVDRGAAESDCAPVLGCPAVPNSTGGAGILTYVGATAVGADGIELRATRLVPGVFGLFVVSRDAAFVANPGGSQGNLCLGGAIGRIDEIHQVKNTGTMGEITLDTRLGEWSLASIPLGGGTTAVLPGERWHFTYWFRDVDGGVQTSNFANGLFVDFN